MYSAKFYDKLIDEKDQRIAELKAEREKLLDDWAHVVKDRSKILKELEIEKSKVRECMDMLDNVKYWETCPEGYIKRINKLEEK